jgi:hypothetical protein
VSLLRPSILRLVARTLQHLLGYRNKTKHQRMVPAVSELAIDPWVGTSASLAAQLIS